MEENGDQGKHGEHGKDGKQRPDGLKTLYIYDLKHPICDSKYCICQPDDSKHSILQHVWPQLKKS